MRLEPARCCACAAPGRGARTSLPGRSSALASPPPGGLPGRLALGCPRSLRPGPTILHSRLPELGRSSPALSAEEVPRRGSGRSPGARHTAEAGKAGGGGRAQARRGAPGLETSRPFPGHLVAPHLLRGPHSTLGDRPPRPGRGVGVAPGSLSRQSRGWRMVRTPGDLSPG